MIICRTKLQRQKAIVTSRPDTSGKQIFVQHHHKPQTQKISIELNQHLWQKTRNCPDEHTHFSCDIIEKVNVFIYNHKTVTKTPCMLLHITDWHMCVCLFVFSGVLHLLNPVFGVLSVYPCLPWVGVGRGDIMKMDDAVTLGRCLSQCKHFLLLYYHYRGWCYCYNSHFRKRLSCSDRKAEIAKWKTETLEFRRWIWLV